MRIVFMGATGLGWECCRTLLEQGQDVVGLFSIPREFRISWSASPVTNIQFRSFEDLASEYSIPLTYITGKMSDPSYMETLRQLRPDILIVIGWYYMLPRSMRELAPLGAVGLHASLLPKYRGGAPLVWAVINGEREAGVSFFHFADGVDDGDIIGQARFEIRDEDDISDVLGKASEASVRLVSEYAPLLASNDAPRIVQNHSLATRVSQRSPEDGLIDWSSRSARQIYDWVRAQTRPYPGAFTFLGQEKLTIWKAALSANEASDTLQPGSIVRAVDASDAFGVACGDGQLLLVREVGLADGASMSGREFAEARNLSYETLLSNATESASVTAHE
ncbi:MAG TPA: methionyl-tRNA formyltransferase [Pyrinomonadaceae bacterium]|nr:methionyl-tRNA formyltransferase [Pyrinomonadaceae bacterium]